MPDSKGMTALHAAEASVKAEVTAIVAKYKELADRLTNAVTGDSDEDVYEVAAELQTHADELHAALNPT